MAPILQNQTGQVDEQVYSDHESIGVAVLVGCAMLSLICVLGMFVLLGVSVVRSRRSSDKTVFVRTHVATYFLSLLICNLAQAIGGVLNIAWIIENRVYVGVACTAQATIKQTGNVGTAIFSFVIAAHTFSLLFLRRQWSDRTCYIILGVSWASLLLEIWIENFILADPTRIGPYYGVAGYWCWISSTYTIERYTTSYLLMCTSAALSFILYLLVFFQLRGNISVSAGYKIDIHRRPKVRVGRTGDGTYIITDDPRVESHLTRVAKHMLWYPLVYTVLVLPMAASRLSTFSGASVPFSVTIITASVFMLHGCFNTLLLCTTRNILPGSWRQRFGLGTTRDGGRGGSDQSTRTNATWQFSGARARIGAVNNGIAHTVLSVDVEKDVETTSGHP